MIGYPGVDSVSIARIGFCLLIRTLPLYLEIDTLMMTPGPIIERYLLDEYRFEGQCC